MKIDSPHIMYNKALPTPSTLGKAASRLNTIYDRATVSHILGHTEEVDAKHYDYDTVQLSDKQKSMDKLYA